jgi:hypothetical protein
LMMMVIFCLIGSLERERERELCPHWNFLLSIKPFCVCRQHLGSFFKWLMNYHFWIWGFQVSTHVGRFFDFVKNLWFLVFF